MLNFNDTVKTVSGSMAVQGQPPRQAAQEQLPQQAVQEQLPRQAVQDQPSQQAVQEQPIRQQTPPPLLTETCSGQKMPHWLH